MEHQHGPGTTTTAELLPQPDSQTQELMRQIEDIQSVEWVTPWTLVTRSDERTDWLRYGRESMTNHPGFAAIIVLDGKPVESHSWQLLVDEAQLKSCIARLAPY